MCIFHEFGWISYHLAGFGCRLEVRMDSITKKCCFCLRKQHLFGKNQPPSEARMLPAGQNSRRQHAFWWFLLVFNGFWWFLVVFFLMVFSEFLWFLVVFIGLLMLFVVFDGFLRFWLFFGAFGCVFNGLQKHLGGFWWFFDGF